MAMASRKLLSILVLAMMGVLSLAAPQNSNGSFRIENRAEFNTLCTCGISGSSRIVGGVNADKHKWPWQAALMVRSHQFCGGTLINNLYILTAAHCVDGASPSQLTIRLGEHTLSTSGETQVVKKSVSLIIIHPNYRPKSEINDIALLRLSSKVTVTDTVLPVCMPPARPSYVKKTATVTGWGTTSYEGSSSDTLKEVNVTVLSNEACRSNYGDHNIKDTMLCAGSTGKDSCQGDSGGPLVFKDKKGKYDQIGVVSWGYGCGHEGYPGVYTRVNKYLSWIKANTPGGVYCKGMQL